MLIDHHCHLDFPQLAEDRAGVLARAQAAGVVRIITVCTRVRRFEQITAIVDTHAEVFGSVGTHPHNAHEELDVTAAELVRLAQHPKIVAMGEAGLDYHYDFSPREAQRQGFLTHIAAARDSGLPLIIHAREADDDTAAILEAEHARGAFGFVLHCYTGGLDLAMRAVKLGGYVSMSGVLTYKSAESLREVARAVPMDRLLVETDAPYLAPLPYRGKTNEPAFVRQTAAVLAEVRGVTLDEIARVTTANAHRLYSKLPPLAGTGVTPA
jgi:TatD DNase family protein